MKVFNNVTKGANPESIDFNVIVSDIPEIESLALTESNFLQYTGISPAQFLNKINNGLRNINVSLQIPDGTDVTTFHFQNITFQKGKLDGVTEIYLFNKDVPGQLLEITIVYNSEDLFDTGKIAFTSEE